MFNSLTGVYTGKTGHGILLQIGGVEWDIIMSANSCAALPEYGRQCKVYAWLYHSEEQLKLYGFASEEEREVFLDLMKVDGIGSKAAVKILSYARASEVAAAIDSEDLARLEKMPGVGRKTAQKMILALKGKLAAVNEREPKGAEEYAEIIAALADMGYERRACAAAVEKAVSARTFADENADKREELLFRDALMILSARQTL